MKIKHMNKNAIPTRFRRNEVANLCRRKGYVLQRYYDTFYKLWFHRTVPLWADPDKQPLIRVWDSMGNKMVYQRRPVRGRPDNAPVYGLDYCPTQSHTSLQRIWAHMQGKRDLRIVKP